MSTLQLNIVLPEGVDVANIISALQKAGIKEIETTGNDDFIPIDDAMGDIFPSMSHDEIVGGLLKAARKNKDLTQIALAALVSTQKQVISAMEAGRRPVSKEMAHKLAKALDVHYKTFL